MKTDYNNIVVYLFRDQKHRAEDVNKVLRDNNIEVRPCEHLGDLAAYLKTSKREVNIDYVHSGFTAGYIHAKNQHGVPSIEMMNTPPHKIIPGKGSEDSIENNRAAIEVYSLLEEKLGWSKNPNLETVLKKDYRKKESLECSRIPEELEDFALFTA